MKLTWSKGPRDRWGPKTHVLKQDGKHVATVQSINSMWFWYGDGRNTASRPQLLEDCKESAEQHFKSKKGTAK